MKGKVQFRGIENLFTGGLRRDLQIWNQFCKKSENMGRLCILQNLSGKTRFKNLGKLDVNLGKAREKSAIKRLIFCTIL